MFLTVNNSFEEWCIHLKVSTNGDILYKNMEQMSTYKPEEDGNFTISIKETYDEWLAEQILLGEDNEH